MRFGFLLNEVWTGLRRNVTMTVAMILTTAISIGLFGGGLLVVRLADNSRAIYLDRVESQVFLTNDVSANDPTCDADPCKSLRQTIEDRDDVRSVRFPQPRRCLQRCDQEVPAVQGRRGQGCIPRVVRRQARQSRAAQGLRRLDRRPARRIERAEPEGSDRPAFRGARRAVQARSRWRSSRRSERSC